ncbi:nuclear transport factor 2 family protein [Pseudoalteromonas maricaloris]|uniref:nuclear transport factor 2 family protein n=1 Tax=Pseudoalteromonas maricaloris TaxID=184924 RepID=UPI00029AE2F7|nr:DUF4440 domain-containing protein [Pseudoalteromonas flavipulchra]
MCSTSIIKQVIAKECALHRKENRHNMALCRELLHPQFIEVGRSGSQYNLGQILCLMNEEEWPDGEVVAEQFHCAYMISDALLLTYRSAWRNTDGTLSEHAYRSSLWVEQNDKWQLLHHQGTPTSLF